MLAFAAPNFVLLQGVIIGLGYGLLAVGLVLIYRTNRVLNFAQGQVGVIAAVFLVKLTADFHFEYWFALILSLALAAGVGGLSELVLRRLLPMAFDGLERWGVDPGDAKRLLGIIEQRCLVGRTGATWQAETVHALQRRGLSRGAALRQMTQRYVEHMHTNEPVHTWPAA